ncbi:MAG TPA: hypothetical protein VFY38_16190, partial [Pseudonocardia sp.]|nr:hypothetical protein [Pseudonocardia sp.]
LQRLAAQITQAANSPARAALGEAAMTVSLTVERAAGTVAGAGNEVGEEVGAEITETPEQPARHLPDAPVEAPVEATIEATAAGPVPPPIPGFADLTGHAAVAALRTLDEPRDVAAMLEFEQEHGNRPGVLAAARLRSAALGGG